MRIIRFPSSLIALSLTNAPKQILSTIDDAPFLFSLRSSFNTNSSRTGRPPFTKPPHSKNKKFSVGRPSSKPLRNPLRDLSEDIHRCRSHLPPRFSSEDLARAISSQSDPIVCLHLFNWASQQPRFKHDISTYEIAIKKLGCSMLYDDMDVLVDQVLADSSLHSEPVFNTIIYLYCEGRKLSRAVRVFKHMKKSRESNCKPSLKTYNLLFNAMVSNGSNSYISHMYMQTMRCLYRQMTDDGVRPDIFTLNFMIRGYVSSMHLNDALRIFSQIEAIYECQPNRHTYNYLIHGLSAQGRSINATALYKEMVSRSYTPSTKAYNSLVSCLAISGEIEDAIRFMKEMIEKGRLVETLTCRAVLDEVCRLHGIQEAKNMLWELKENGHLDGVTFRDFLYHLEDQASPLK